MIGFLLGFALTCLTVVLLMILIEALTDGTGSNK